MKISDVRIRKITDGDGKLKAIASVTIDDSFVIHDIKIIDGTEGLFISMPNRKTKDGVFKDIAHPINSETRKTLSDLILKAYETALKKYCAQYNGSD